MAKDESVTVKFKVKVNEDVNGEVLKNTAKVNDGNHDSNTNEVTNPSTTNPKKPPVIPEIPKKPTNPNDHLPNTGEGTNLMSYGIALFLSGVTLLLLGLKTKREEIENESNLKSERKND